MQIELKEVVTQCNPAEVYKVFQKEENTILLESGLVNDKLGKYSFIGINPFLVIKSDEERCLINGVEEKCDIFEKLMEVLSRYRVENKTELPFIGGCIGYFSYDFGIRLEEIKEDAVETVQIPDYYFVFYDNLIIFDHNQQKIYVSACGMKEGHKESIAKIEERINQAKSLKQSQVKESKTTFHSNFTKEDYIATVTKVKEYIRSGDVYIMNLTQQFTAETDKDSYQTYLDLRTINPAPFAAFYQLEGFEIISASPERFLSIRDGIVETRPIKGTRPRGQNEVDDLKNREELLNSEKDKSELLMIVDLERNDLSKVCKPHSVKVKELFSLEEYSTVFHLVSTVVGELKEGIDAVQCFRECFPGGSITGAPKIRAMELIDELEGLKRGIYTGCMGYFSFDGNADFNIVIRTAIKKDGKAYFGVGGGITWESIEEEEYQETLHKAKALMRVI